MVCSRTRGYIIDTRDRSGYGTGAAVAAFYNLVLPGATCIIELTQDRHLNTTQVYPSLPQTSTHLSWVISITHPRVAFITESACDN
ncbi:hypothetical protein Y032_0037g3522 [Ancylostoma ceylanicum]|uniref:Uncharacterized protein n=1 Tax=Ancylostoma ceylanicum TaxID=53326 RepID=A0A016UJQ1_9BILA|nr:hypothetical protein Y032_0037g3522 [Ancylostoma ceylanicum]